MRALYIVGAPGSGKSTLMAALLGPSRGDVELMGVPATIHDGGWTQLGRQRGAFSGTDALGYAISPRAVDLVNSEQAPRLLAAEGARLANSKFLPALIGNYRTRIVYLTGDDVAWRRMLARHEALGIAPHKESWWRGRATAARNAAMNHGAVCVPAHLDTESQVEMVLADQANWG